MLPNQQQQQQNPGSNPSMVSPEEVSERQLLELLQMMDNFTPVVPDALMDYLMVKSGVECDDVRLKRLVALVAQKYITDIANDAMHYGRQRQSGAPGGAAVAAAIKAGAGGPGGKKATLTMEDLIAALADRGINVKRPNYFT